VIAYALEKRLNELEVRFREISTEKVPLRLSNQVVRLMKQVGKQADEHIEIALSRRELAQLTGTALFTAAACSASGKRRTLSARREGRFWCGTRQHWRSFPAANKSFEIRS
jgi:hypothetical protein